jgi:HSP20 family protein
MQHTNIFDQILNRSISDIVGTDFNLSVPSANIVELEDRFQIIVAAPGLDKVDFKIKVDKEILHISADKENTSLPDGIVVKRKEFNYSKFQRNFTLPKDIDKDQISAEYTDGLLTISLIKKMTPAPEVKVIEIN